MSWCSAATSLNSPRASPGPHRGRRMRQRRAHRAARRGGPLRRDRGTRRLQALLDVSRKRRTESGLARRFDVVTTISDADSRAVEGPRGVPGTVHTVPNGLDDAYAGPLPAAGDRRGVVFWGNQTFAPNQDALRFFVHDVFLPRLRDQDVELCVVGAQPPPWLVELAAEEPAIVLARLRRRPACHCRPLPDHDQPDALGQRAEEQGPRGLRSGPGRGLHPDGSGGPARGAGRRAPRVRDVRARLRRRGAGPARRLQLAAGASARRPTPSSGGTTGGRPWAARGARCSAGRRDGGSGSRAQRAQGGRRGCRRPGGPSGPRGG